MPWHTEPSQDLEARRQMINLIANFLEKRHPKTAEVQEALVSTARKLEVALYKACKTKQEYMETRTLPTRIRELERTGNFALEAPAASQTAPTTNGNQAATNPATNTATTANTASGDSKGVGASNTVATNQATSATATAAPASQAQVPVASNAASNGANPGAASGQSSASNATAPSTQHALTQSDIVKQRRNRLIALRHASRCKEVKCLNPWCPDMKRLWEHVSQCKSTDCQVRHCVSSHFVLTHYSKCRDPDCEVCSPVRDPQQRKRLIAAKQQAAVVAAERANQSTEGGKENISEEEKVRKIVNASGVSVSAAIDKRFARGSRDGTGPSLPLSMTRGDVEKHMHALRVEVIQQACMPLLRRLMEHSRLNPQGLFNYPVEEKDAPGYSKVISKPMDFGTIRRRLEDGKYSDAVQLKDDMDLVFKNAMKYNPETNLIHGLAKELKGIADAEMVKIAQKLADSTSWTVKKNQRCQLCNDEQQLLEEPATKGKKAAKVAQCESCPLCGRGCIPYEPRILFCSGPNCNQSGTRIPRNATFYSLPGSSLNWCSECHDAGKKDIAFVTDVGTGTQYNKSDLSKRKNDAVFPEPWVQCEKCLKWCHQTCALFNHRKQNSSNKEDGYLCPQCLLDSGYECAKKVPAAEDLEHTKLSKFIEMWVRKKLQEAYDEDKRNPPRIRGADPPPPNSITIRILSNFDETFPLKTYAKTVCGFPETLSYRSRAIFLFQHLDGVDILLFVMYVQEYGSDAPPPNRGKIYIAYLDSVHFFRPRQYRTLVYHELLLSYLEYSRRLGFTSCYIWACPPATKRDDYILHCHPEDQRVPNAERLRMWYHEMIRRGVSEHIVLSSCSLFEEHYDASFKKVVAKKKDSKKGLGGGSKKAAAARQDGNGKIIPDKEVPTSTTQTFEEVDDLLNEMIEDDTNPMPSVTPAITAPSTPGPETTNLPLTTPSRRASTSPTSGEGPLLLGMHKSDMEELDFSDVEKRRSNKLAVRFQMPVFDGDYWPNEMEDVALEQARRGEVGDGKTPGKGAKKAGAGRRASGGSVTLDQLAASGQLKDIDPKVVLNRIGESLEAMNADFLVVKLAHECSVCGKYLLRGRWECRHPECLKNSGFNRPSPFALCNECFKVERARPSHLQHGQEVQQGIPVEDPGDLQVPPASGEKTEPTKDRDDDNNTAAGSESGDTPNSFASTNGNGSSNENGATNGTSTAKGASTEVEKPSGSSGTEEAKQPTVSPEVLAQWEQQPLHCTRMQPISPASSSANSSQSHQLVYVDEGLPLITPRDDKVFRNHLLDTRHAFLGLCTGNRYAFNQLRRAKHSTMMVLYHLHNPEAPAHLRSCNRCQEDIIAGYRYNCQLCQGGDYDLCEGCYRNYGHDHKMTRVLVTRGVDQEEADTKRQEEQRRQRHSSLQIFLNALVHASSCTLEPSECCELACTKMKELLAHRRDCQIRVRNGCEICRRVLCLVQMHAKGTENMPPCSLDKCPVPHCDDLKRHLRQREAEANNAPTPRPGSAPPTTTKSKGRPGTQANPKKKQTKLDANAVPQAGPAQEGAKGKTAGIKRKGANEQGDKPPMEGGSLKVKVKLTRPVQTLPADGGATSAVVGPSTGLGGDQPNGTTEPTAKRMRATTSPRRE